jgi:hypothetical protein
MYLRDGSPEARDAMLEAAEPLGLLTEMMSYANDLSEEERMDNVNQINSILTPLSSNNVAGAIEEIEKSDRHRHAGRGHRRGRGAGEGQGPA